MTYDYDLVIIGASRAGMAAARLAAQWRSRVALVTHNTTPWPLTGGLGWASLHQSTFPLPLNPDLPSLAVRSQWAATVSHHFSQADAPERLMALGVDVIDGVGAFHARPQLGLDVAGRTLRSRRYLIAVGTEPTDPPIPGLHDTPHLTPDRLLQLSPEEVSQYRHAIVIGANPTAIALAQAWQRSGCGITLVPQAAQILPTMDTQAAWLLQAQLEADGVQVLSPGDVTQVRQLDGQMWVQAGDRAIAADTLLLVPPARLATAGLNLAAVGVRLNTTGGIWVSDRLQTTNPQIYACGNPIDGEVWEHIAGHEATTAVDNALFWPRRRVNPRTLPRVVWTEPPFVSVGLTVAQARRYWYYGQSLHVLQQPYKHLAAAHLRDQTTGFCQLIVRDRLVVGAQVVGAEAVELVGAIALAIQQRVPIDQLHRLATPSPTCAEILQQTAAQWQVAQAQQPWRRDWLETFFNWRRTGVW